MKLAAEFTFILLEPAPQCGLVDAENRCGTFETLNPRHDARDVLPFEVPQGDVSANPRMPTVIHLHDICKSLSLDRITRPDQEGSLDDVLDLAQVRWPRILEQGGRS